MRVLIAGTGSGSGKTTVTSGLLQCLVNRGLDAAAFKCGPDYIDPMFYERITGARAGNLDPFFSDEKTLRWIISRAEERSDISVIEGVMGYYDGIGFTSEASTFSVARAVNAPVVLVINCRGMGASVGAVLKGFLDWPEITDSCIKGVIFNNMSEKLYRQAAEMAESMGVRPLGYLPRRAALTLESRHLGLVTAGEVADIKEKMKLIASEMEKTVDIKGIIDLAAEAPALRSAAPEWKKKFERQIAEDTVIMARGDARRVRIALASDDAFCFTYKENTALLQEAGCEIVPFSPLSDTGLPDDIDGVILSGGYPELHAAELAANKPMLEAVRQSRADGIPMIAECGGFMYLHETLEGADGELYRMAGVIPGRCFRTERLGRFGYITLKALEGGLLCPEGSELKAHEFHYWDSEHCGESFLAVKPDGSRSWKCGIMTDDMYAGFPHLFYYDSPKAAMRFVHACAGRRKSL
ncbi:MAG: cobyrinate a,c-diamide synthase [Anaerovoracaceae bacterium]|nr:cobyrinate a,c-diamide synthase [Bacillota bacterium]MDD7734361.1 cobyrinate a,c-diamide synthase [Bacillota bacterium]MDY5907016.1 cobyrinate a,c-diamide synthase [Anaerovoracaceae bacterium]